MSSIPIIEESKAKNRIAIFMPYDNLFFSPSIINAIRMLRRKEYIIDIILPYNKKGINYDFGDSGVYPHYYYSDSKGTLLEIIKGKFLFFIVSFFSCLCKSYSCFIGIDVNGLLLARVIGFFKKIPVCYYSLELWLSEDNVFSKYTIHHYLYNIRKHLERICNRYAIFTVVQDENRADILAVDNKIKRETIYIVPNAPLGSLQASKGRWWHKKFNISENKKIILHAGSIAKWTCCYELVEAALQWPDEYVLIIHGRVEDQVYLDNIKNLVGKSKKVYISLEVVSYEILDNLICSADIGIALYKDINKNHFFIPSGKVTHYLRCGLPVIAQDFPSLENLIVQNHCGFCVNSANEIKDAIKSILNNYQEFSQNAKNLYLNKLEYSLFFKRVLENIDTL